MEKEIQLQIRRRLKEERQVEFKHALNEVRDEAAANGLTEEILERILHEEDIFPKIIDNMNLSSRSGERVLRKL